MSDYSELERRAQAAIDAIGTLSRARQEMEFNDVCTPQVVKALIAENKRLQKLISWQGEGNNKLEVNAGPLMKHMDERDRLRAEVDGLKTGYEAYEQVVQGLKAENEALRVDAERYRWLRNQADAADWEFLSHQSRETVDQNIDCALTPSGRGGQS